MDLLVSVATTKERADRSNFEKKGFFEGVGQAGGLEV